MPMDHTHTTESLIVRLLTVMNSELVPNVNPTWNEQLLLILLSNV